jgi:hypothetical protein
MNIFIVMSDAHVFVTHVVQSMHGLCNVIVSACRQKVNQVLMIEAYSVIMGDTLCKSPSSVSWKRKSDSIIYLETKTENEVTSREKIGTSISGKRGSITDI